MSLLLHHSAESGSAPDSPLAEQSSPPALSLHFTPLEPRTGDLTTGLELNHHRWHDPTPGQWISEEPVGFAGDAENLTRYVSDEAR